LTFSANEFGFETGDAAQHQTHGSRAPGAGIDLVATQELSFADRLQVVSQVL
jgi:hypothetical protein